MQIDLKEPIIVRTNFEIEKVVDGDGIIVRDIISNKSEEIRFYGIDAPESTLCDKLKRDEAETHLPARFLLELGKLSLNYLITRAKIGKRVTVVSEVGNEIDQYGRTLAYVYLPNGRTLNEIMIRQGYAKAYNKVYCSMLPYFQELNLKAKKREKGLYSMTKYF